jgi:aspartyl-tRNA(Asn)/glutamyl-tRNA(Gln) amidotransferase subunit C
MAPLSLTRADVQHLARLANLILSEAEIDRFTIELGAILAHVSEIQTADTSRVARSDIATPGAEGWRDDTAEPSIDRDRVLAAAPDAHAGFFRVPRARG